MEWKVTLEDAAINRLPPEELKELIEQRCDQVETLIKYQINHARKMMGLKPMEEEEDGSGPRDS